MTAFWKVIAAGALVAAVAACGSDAADDAVDAPVATPIESTGDPDPATTPSGVAPGATRTVEGADGPIEIPAEPQRIVADLMTIDYLTALGYDTSKIIGVFEAGWFEAIDDHYLSDFFDTQDVMDPGSSYDVNLEALAAADPDLILAPFDQLARSPMLEQIEQIAPTLLVPTSEGEDPEGRYGGTASFQDWRSTIRSYGKVMNLQDEAEAYIAETEASLQELSDEYGEMIRTMSAIEAKSTPDSVAINVLGDEGGRGVLGSILMGELGFAAPERVASIEPDEYGTIELSPENIDLLDADILFLEVREGATTHTDSPLWETLDVVQADNVVVVGNHWEYGGAVAARKVIDDLRAALEHYASHS